jgi:hypothetical protein
LEANVSTNDGQYEIEFPVFNQIPQALTAYDQWVNWDFGSDAIVQVGEHMSARQAYENGLETGLGLGFILAGSDPFAVVELYDAMDAERGQPKPWAWAIMKELESYAEIDASTLRVFMVGNAENVRKDNIAIYGSGILVPVTGNVAGTHVEIQNCQVEIDTFIEKHLAPTVMDSANALEKNGLLDRDTLSYLLDLLFKDDIWHEQHDLFPFIAKCLVYPDLKLRILGKVQMWRKDRYESFMACLNAEIPKKEAEEKPRLERRERSEAGSEVDLEDILQVDTRGKAKETFYNMSMILQHHPEWKGRFGFDSFFTNIIFDGEPITDTKEERIAEWLGYNYGFGGNNPKWLTRGIHAASTVRTYDSLQDWIGSLPKWDGKNRLDTWMMDCCGSPQNDLTAWIGYVTIMQMIARARTPGCMARLVTIFEGPENKGKTSCIHALGNPWSMTFDMSMDSKEAHMAVHGCWVAELAELDTLRKTTETRLKSFVSQTKDTYIPKFANHKISHLRRTVFIGTTNEDNYLPGQTGNTRWLPIKTLWFDIERIQAEREQLFSEAIAIFEGTPDIQWWEEKESICHLLAAARDDRRIVNVYEDPMQAWLDGTDRYDGTHKRDITFQEIATEYLQADSPQAWKDPMMQRQIREALRAIKWRPSRVTRNGRQVRGWVRESDIPDDDEVPF